ncbi:hypothetical protein AX16_004457 [Volvariella volvacea WC 439]|nr:hypothetical protein AX16_004457 [Volvariella volvacea WC 439]
MTQFLIIAGLLSFSLLYFTRRWKWRQFPYPPGPKEIFLIGNILDFPRAYQWRTFFDWTKLYAEELLDQRSAIYSDRPRSTMVTKLMGWGFAFFFMKYVTNFKPHIMKVTHTLMRNLLDKPDDFNYFVRHMTAEVILLITYGIRISPENDPCVNAAEQAVAAVAQAALPGSFFVDVFPWLKYVPEWFPFAGFQCFAKKLKRHTMEMVDIPYNAVRDTILSGNGIDSLVADGLCAVEDKGFPKEWEGIVKRVAGAMYAVKDCLIHYDRNSGAYVLPDVLKKAQAEIDAVVTPGNLPDFDDKKSLPYLSAVIKEIMRGH